MRIAAQPTQTTFLQKWCKHGQFSILIVSPILAHTCNTAPHLSALASLAGASMSLLLESYIWDLKDMHGNIVNSTLLDSIPPFYLYEAADGYVMYHDHEVKRPRAYHRYLIRAKTCQIVDHHDGDKLNNTMNNLRFVTQHQNLINKGPSKLNTSGHRGVCWSKNRCKWQASVKCNNQYKYLGCYTTKAGAVAARSAWDAAHPEYAQWRRS
jgi:hypothetical protein